MIPRITKWLITGTVAGIVLGILDGLALVFTASSMFFDTVEMGGAILYSVAICAFSGTLLALFSAPIAIIIEQISPRSRKIVLSTGFALPLSLLFWFLTNGPQASTILARPFVVGGLSILLGVAAALLILWAAKQFQKWILLIMAGSGILSAFILVAIDLFVFVRLYVPFHIALTLCTWLLLTLSPLLLWKSKPRLMVQIISAILLIGISTGGILALKKVRKTQNTRFVIGENTAATTDIVRIAKVLFPPADRFVLDESPAREESIVATARPQKLKLPGASILLVTIDAMRYDRIDPDNSNNHRNTAPAINALANEGTVFERAYTALPHTSYAVASFLTGKYIKPLFEIPDVTADQETWPELMRRFRYRTGGFFTRSIFFIDRSKFKPLENKGYGFGYLKMEYRFTADQKVNQALNFLKKMKDKNVPIFTWVHLFEPHEPYKPECTHFGTEDEQRYDCEIYTADKELKRLFDYVEEYFPGTIIIVAADHGEEFDDHGGKYHGTTLYDEQVRVPLVIRVPGVPHRVIKEPVNLVDIMGTVLSIVDIPVPPRVRSNNLTGLILNTDTEKKAAFSQLHERRMVVYDSHKLIWDQSSDLVRLYDLKNDPKETRSIADKNPKMVMLLKQKIAQWESTHATAELRPVTTKNGVQSWPIPVQRALGGDPSMASKLGEFLSDKTPQVVRRKAAALLFEMGQPGQLNIPLKEINDPEVLTWVWCAKSRSAPNDAIPILTKLEKDLEPYGAPWLQSLLTRASNGDVSTIPAMIDIAINNALAPAVRTDAINILGELKAFQAESALIDLLDNYQLRLPTAQALAKLKSQNAVASLQTHLRHEPFISRRAELTSCIATIEGEKAATTVALQLTMEKPIPNGLPLLAAMDVEKQKEINIANPQSGKHATYVQNSSLTIKADRGEKLFFVVEENAPIVTIFCNGEPLQTLKDITAHRQQEISLSNCSSPDSVINVSLGPKSLSSPVVLAVY